MLAEDLGNTSFDWNHDPRPAKYRNWKGYKDHVRNATVNYCARTGRDVTMRYAFEKAAIGEAEKDHDYLESPLVQY